MSFAEPIPSSNTNGCSVNKALVVSQKPNVSLSLTKLWHARLGHPQAKTLKNVLNKIHVTASFDNNDVCESCQFGKLSQASFPKSDSATTKPLELVYSDLWGPAPVNSSEGFRYYMLFVDDYSRHMWIYPLKYKSEAFKVFTYFHCFAEKQLDAKLKCLQTDWGVNFDLLLDTCSSMALVLGTLVLICISKMVS